MTEALEKCGMQIVIKNGAAFLKDWFKEYKIYKLNTEKPYIRWAGQFWYLDNETAEEVRKALAA